MDLTVPTSLALQFPRPPARTHSSSARCTNCGQTGHLRSTCCAPPRSPSARLSSLKFGQHVSRSPRPTADAFRPGGACPQCFVCGSPTHLGQACPFRPATSKQTSPVYAAAAVECSQVRFPDQPHNDQPPEGCLFPMLAVVDPFLPQPVTLKGVCRRQFLWPVDFPVP